MIRRLLVANRGEIARRLIRGAHDAGCEAVAVYAADDVTSPYVGEADAAVLLPGATLSETYLSAPALVGAAKAAGADGLHPGYGFLSENSDLAEACAAAGVICTHPTSSNTATVTIGRLSQPGPPQGHFRLAFAALNFMTIP